jgi:chromate transporter
VAFGGPAAHIAMMRHEVVERRRWLSEERFLDLLGATHLIPGPNSTEMAIHLGFLRAGWAGLAVAGLCFILPAMTIVLGLAWSYGRYGSLPHAQWLLYGVKPVVIAVVGHALCVLGRRALRSAALAGVAAGVLALYLAGANELMLLFGGGLAGALLAALPRLAGQSAAGIGLSWARWNMRSALAAARLPAAMALAGGAVQPFSPALLFFTFLKIGAVLYGSGYVLLALMRNDFVERLGWLTEQQLLDAVSVGQFTPGPVFTTATFVGYFVGSKGGLDVGAGVLAGLLATAAIFTPAFVLVASSGPLVRRLRDWPSTRLVLDGINASALGLMAAVTIVLGRAALVDGLTAALALGALGLLVRFKVNAAWLVLLGGLVGLAWRMTTA